KFSVPVHQMLPRRALSWFMDVTSTFIRSSVATPLATAKTHSLFRPGSMESARLRPTKLKGAKTPKAFGRSGESLLRPLEYAKPDDAMELVKYEGLSIASAAPAFSF